MGCGIGTQSIVGVAGGATRAAMTQHQARRDNMADVAAKDGSQVTHFVLVKALLFLCNLVSKLWKRYPCNPEMILIIYWLLSEQCTLNW